MPHLVEESDGAGVLHDPVHAVHVEHDLAEGAEDEVLQLHLVLLAEDYELGQAANLD